MYPWDDILTEQLRGDIFIDQQQERGARVDSGRARPYAWGMSEELPKRLEDLHKRFDDLRADMGARFAGVDKRIDDLRADMEKRFSDLRADMLGRFAAVDKRFDDLRADMLGRFAAVDRRFDDMNQRLTDMNHRLTDIYGTLRVFMWVVSGWFTFLTAVLAVFGFLRR